MPGLIPPYDLSLVGTITASTFAYDWVANSIANLCQTQSTTGNQPGTAPLNRLSARHFFTQSAIDEKLAKMCGLAGAFNSGAAFKDKTTRAIINLTNGTYTGLPAPSAGQRAVTWTNPQGSWTYPPTNNKTFPFEGSGSGEYSHKPELGYYAYLVSGEPQFLDIISEAAPAGILSQLGDNLHRNPTNPYAASAIGVMFSKQIRLNAWTLRDLAVGAGIMPDNYPDGTQLSLYVTDLATANLRWLIDAALTTSVLNSYCVNTGYWMLSYTTVGTGPATKVATVSPWMMAFMVSAVCFAYGLTGDLKAKAWLEAIATRYLHVYNTFGGWCLYGPYEHTMLNWNDDNGAPPISSDDQWGLQFTPGTITWNTTSPAFNMPAPSKGWTLTTGDKFMLDASVSSNVLPAGGLYTRDTPMYAVNVVGNQCDLSLTPGGVAIAPPTTNVGSQRFSNSFSGDGGPWFVPAATPTAGTQPSSYAFQVHLPMAWIKALGLSSPSLGDLAAPIADSLTRIPGYDWNQTPEWAVQTTL